ncbi:hypothetical protein [Streptomyces kaniharaensis]|uniref:hypothetical protein n=1 Tax=Streptomyces kaniharaensis TaxID=212423 RepID=UPI002DDD0B54|nr:hypothetical protein [Streptomyces kaniharaensis]
MRTSRPSSLAEPTRRLAPDPVRQPMHVRVRAVARHHRHRVRACRPQPEPLRPIGRRPEIAAAVQQVVDELPSCRLLLADRHPLRPLAALAQCGQRGIGRRQHGLAHPAQFAGAARGRDPRQCVPRPPGRRQAVRDHLEQPEPGLGTVLAELPHALQLGPAQQPPGAGGVGEQVEVARGQFGGCVVLVPRRHRVWCRPP